MRPPDRLPGEDRETWIVRLSEWELSADGKAAAAAASIAAAALKKNEQRSRLLAMGAPPVAIDVLDSIQETDFVGAVRGSGGGNLLVLSGNVGRGKTIAACVAMLDVLQSGWESLFVRSIALARWARYDEDEMARLLDVRLLIIDDLGLEYWDAKGNFGVLLDEIATTRSESNLRTILTTNLGLGDFRVRYGERLASRVAGHGGFFVGKGRDLRVKP
jgi:DNA replication protein DnaC